jgi:hypothetical protein
VYHGVLEHHLLVGIEKARHVIGVHVGDDYDVNLIWRHTGISEMFRQLAQCRHEMTGTTGVNQNHMLAGIDQPGIYRGSRFSWKIRLVQ